MPSQLLMAVTRKLCLKAAEELSSRLARGEWQPHLQIRAFEPAGLVFNEPAHQPVHEVVRRFKSRNQELLEALLDVAG